MKPTILLLLAATFWGLNFHLAKILLSYVNFIEAGFWRYLFGVGFLFILQIRQWKSGSISAFMKAPMGVLLVGFIGLFGFNLLFFFGLQYTTALNAALVISLNPMLTLLLASWLLKSTINRQQKMGMSIALLGVIYLLSRGHPEQLLQLKLAVGDLLIFGANLLFALHHVWVKKYSASYNNSSLFTLITNGICLMGFIFCLPILGITTPSFTQLDFWLSVIGIGVFGTGIAYLFWNKGIEQTGAENAGLFMNIVPLAAAIFALFFGEKLEVYHAVSGGLILLGLLIVQKNNSIKG